MSINQNESQSTIFQVGPNDNPVRHVFLRIQGDATYPGGNGTTDPVGDSSLTAEQFIRAQIKKDSRYVSPVNPQDSPASGGAWIDRSHILDWQPSRINATGVQQLMFFDKANDALQVRSTTDDSPVGAGDLSGTFYYAHVYIG